MDCVLLLSRGKRGDRDALKELREGLPFLRVAIVGQKNFDRMVNKVFASDRHGTPKGMIEVIT